MIFESVLRGYLYVSTLSVRRAGRERKEMFSVLTCLFVVCRGLDFGKRNYLEGGVQLMRRFLELAAGPLKDGHWQTGSVEQLLRRCEAALNQS